MPATITAIPTPLAGGPAVRRPTRTETFTEIREATHGRILTASALVVGLAAVTTFTLAVIALVVAS
ncbi:hypothetical protein J2Y89_001728 [Curtobacterium herbarum]|uniref:hypothetical protein n=1 Tax=Curtobacterium TaxID=2034 RepID=UPI00209E329C|nr:MULTISPECIES: hypothetical protein [Curtobacterium]MCP1502984.1 hypothetical protein [Curtobacterium herbarum]MDN3477213.1 hypothetical protein [Curtobacterium sp. APC 4022]MDY1005892.1 hypothetical protein [Curtobacterium sp. CFBP9011]